MILLALSFPRGSAHQNESRECYINISITERVRKTSLLLSSSPKGDVGILYPVADLWISVILLGALGIKKITLKLILQKQNLIVSIMRNREYTYCFRAKHTTILCVKEDPPPSSTFIFTFLF